MAERELSSYQKGVIRNYRENLDTIMLTKLQELVTELYLADSDAKRERLWLRVQKAMANLKLTTEAMDDIMQRRSAEYLAARITEWLGK